MKIDAALLTKGYSTSDSGDFYAEFYADGQLQLFRHARTGASSRAITQHLEHGQPGGHAETSSTDSYVPNRISLAEEIFADFVEEQDRFRGWAEYGIEQIYNLADTGIKCHFCEKRQHEVERLIAGPLAYICNECVRLCIQILDEEVSS